MKLFKKDKISLNYEGGQISSATNNIAFTSSFCDKKPEEICIKRRAFYDVLAIFISSFFASIGYGMLSTLISFRLESNIQDEVLISFSALLASASGVFLAKYLTSFVKKFGLIKSFNLAAFFAAICGIFFFFYINYFIWLVISFLFGIAIFVVNVTRQVMTIEVAPKKIKALIISCIGTITAIGNGFGPVILKIIKTEDAILSFLVAGIFLLLALLPLKRLNSLKMHVAKEKSIGLLRYIKNSPKIMGAGFCFNYCFASLSSFLIIYGLKIGLDKNQASSLYSALFFGTAFSIAIGYLVDIINRRFMMILGAFISICLANYIFLSDYKNMHLPLFLMFGALIAMKIPAIVLINEKYKKTQRLAVNAAFMKFSIFGGITGILTTGFLMKDLGPNGLWASVIFVLGSFLIFCGANYLYKFSKVSSK